jgi:hypothetical protein
MFISVYLVLFPPFWQLIRPYFKLAIAIDSDSGLYTLDIDTCIDHYILGSGTYQHIVMELFNLIILWTYMRYNYILNYRLSID